MRMIFLALNNRNNLDISPEFEIRLLFIKEMELNNHSNDCKEILWYLIQTNYPMYYIYKQLSYCAAGNMTEWLDIHRNYYCFIHDVMKRYIHDIKCKRSNIESRRFCTEITQNTQRKKQNTQYIIFSKDKMYIKMIKQIHHHFYLVYDCKSRKGGHGNFHLNN